MWRPETKVTHQIRQYIYEHPDEWRKATRYKRFTNTWDMMSDDEDAYLKRVPKEYDSEFEYADDLRLKTFIAGSKLTQKTVTSPEFDDELAKLFKSGSDLNRFLCDAEGLPY